MNYRSSRSSLCRLLLRLLWRLRHAERRLQQRTFLAWLPAQAWIGNLINAKVDQRQRCPQERNANAGRQKPPPRAEQERITVLREIEHRSQLTVLGSPNPRYSRPASARMQ